jgi:GNAT superfamily N-acetyltransferase
MTMPDEPLPDLLVLPTSALAGSDKEAIMDVCTRAFAEDFGELFELVDNSMHVLATLDGRLVGHACWATRWLQPEGCAPLRTAYVDAVAVEPNYQGRGIGSAVMRRLNAEVQSYELGGLSTDRVAFYERTGWELWRGPIGIRTPEGTTLTPDDAVMILRTALTPTLDLHALLTAEPRPVNPW